MAIFHGYVKLPEGIMFLFSGTEEELREIKPIRETRVVASNKQPTYFDAHSQHRITKQKLHPDTINTICTHMCIYIYIYLGRYRKI